MKVGDWAAIGKLSSHNHRITFDCGQITKVTEKMVNAKAHYGSQHSRENVIVMPDEASARLFVERSKSAWAEAENRQSKAWVSYSRFIAKMIFEASS